MNPADAQKALEAWEAQYRAALVATGGFDKVTLMVKLTLRPSDWHGLASVARRDGVSIDETASRAIGWGDWLPEEEMKGWNGKGLDD